MEDPLPNDLDNALSQLIPAVTACGSNPRDPEHYLKLDVFEAGLSRVGAYAQLAEDGRGRRVLDERFAGEIEVAFRHCMHEAATDMADAAAATASGTGEMPNGASRKGKGRATDASAKLFLDNSAPLGLLSLAVEFVTNEVASTERKVVESALTGLPMVLLEDFLESQGREICKAFWSTWVEDNAKRLTTAPMMQGGKYTLIRLCKKLAQRMSKTHDSLFCGQIHLFLSNALGFFERSGLNVTGGVNSDNVTAFEDEEQFRKAMWGFDAEEEGSSGGPAPGSRAAVSLTSGDAMDVDAGTAPSGRDGDGEEGRDKDDFPVDYRLYQSFWRLQEHALKPDAAVKGEAARSTWKAILDDVDKILGAFEANAFSEHDLRLAREKWSSSSASSQESPRPGAGFRGDSSDRTEAFSLGENKNKRKRDSSLVGVDTSGAEGMGQGDLKREQSGYFGLKYLTSSRLLRLQLRDPTLRLQVLTQWLILAASLKSKVGSNKESPNSASDLNPRMERAKKLVRGTPPRGEEYLNMLQTVLHRESAWTKWKDVGKCNNIESVADAESKAAAAAAAAAAGGRGQGSGGGGSSAEPPRTRRRVHPSSADAERARTERAMHAPLGGSFPLEQMVAKLSGGVPNSEAHLEDQRMYANDPETNPAEYPSASPLYTWRALRLLGAEDPANLADCFDGDLVKTMERLNKAKPLVSSAGGEPASAQASGATGKSSRRAESSDTAKPSELASKPPKPSATPTDRPPPTTTKPPPATAAAVSAALPAPRPAVTPDTAPGPTSQQRPVADAATEAGATAASRERAPPPVASPPLAAAPAASGARARDLLSSTQVREVIEVIDVDVELAEGGVGNSTRGDAGASDNKAGAMEVEGAAERGEQTDGNGDRGHGGVQDDDEEEGAVKESDAKATTPSSADHAPAPIGSNGISKSRTRSGSGAPQAATTARSDAGTRPAGTFGRAEQRSSIVQSFGAPVLEVAPSKIEPGNTDEASHAAALKAGRWTGSSPVIGSNGGSKTNGDKASLATAEVEAPGLADAAAPTVLSPASRMTRRRAKQQDSADGSTK